MAESSFSQRERCGSRMKTITGRCEFVPYSSENGYCIAKIVADDGQTWSAKGEFSFRRHQRYEISGEPGADGYGQFLAVICARLIVPPTTDGLRSVLVQFDGIGPATARRLIDVYGDQTIDVLRTRDVNEIAAAIPRLRVETIEAFRDAYGASEAEFAQMSSVRSLIRVDKRGDFIARTAIKKWKADAARRIAENPWSLADLDGIGFQTADAVALALGRDPRCRERIQAGAIYAIEVLRSGGSYHDPVRGQNVMTMGGSTLHDEGTVQTATLGLLQLRPTDADQALASEAIAAMVASGAIVRHGPEERPDSLMLRCDDKAETAIAAMIAQRCARPAAGLQEVGPCRVSDLFERKCPADAWRGLMLDQQVAVSLILGHGTSILTGAPGTGKTYSVQAILAAYGGRVLLAAPTGKAAKRLAEMTGRETSTIHRLLEAKPDNGRFRFTRDEHNPIDADLVVLDEVSMVGPDLMRSFLHALRGGTDLLLVGDPHQLPSIAAGSVLRDLIACGVVPVASLTTIKRQDPGAIITGCHDMMHGRAPQRLAAKDLLHIPSDSPADIAAKVIEAYLDVARPAPLTGAVPDAELAPVQILSPFRKRGEASAEAINAAIQQELVRRGAVIALEGCAKFALGDRVIQTKNNYGLGIVNGDMGVIVGWLPNAKGACKTLLVTFSGYDDRKPIEIPATVNNLDLAYAITVHKSQGSEWLRVIIPVHSSFGGFFDRCLCYTAMSRARDHLTLIGQAGELGAVAQRTGAQRRATLLAERIANESKILAEAGA
jgi:exodeoxyribonuclease V alpha subunit